MRRYRWLVLAIMTFAVTACASPSRPAAPAGLTYTCCDAADINKTYRPGETLKVHWTAQGTPVAGSALSIELTATLAGPFSSVADLKNSVMMKGAPAVTLAADTVRPTGALGEQPVSVIVIPGDATPGYYNLATTMVEPGSNVSGGSVIEIIAPTTA
jgi:hypothetical protein